MLVLCKGLGLLSHCMIFSCGNNSTNTAVCMSLFTWFFFMTLCLSNFFSPKVSTKTQLRPGRAMVVIQTTNSCTCLPLEYKVV